MTNVLDAIEQRVDNDLREEDENELKLDIHKMIPDVMMDNTDRNRTSPLHLLEINLNSVQLVRLQIVQIQ